jgi:hypothetical protein
MTTPYYKNVEQVTTVLRWSAGFGSNFLQAIDWLWYQKNTGVPIYVDWRYGNFNFFNSFFTQKTSENPRSFSTDAYYISSPLAEPDVTEARYLDLPLYKKHEHMLFGKDSVYQEPNFIDVITFFNKLYKENLTPTPLGIKPETFIDTLGVHARYIGLYYADTEYKVPLYSVIPEEEYYARNLAQLKEKFESGGYKNIFLGCDDVVFFNMCLEEFKDKVMYQNYKRTIYHNWENRLHTKGKMNSQGLAERLPVNAEFTNALVDITALSMCKDFLGSVSSFTFSVLVFNPFKNFELFKTTSGVMTG